MRDSPENRGSVKHNECGRDQIADLVSVDLV
jgi:hypothetical protein